MKQSEIAVINKEDIALFIHQSVEKSISEANERLIGLLRAKFPADEILTTEELAIRINRSVPTVRKMAVALGFIPHEYAENKPPYYLLSEVFQALKKAPGTEWYQVKRNLMESNDIEKKEPVR